MRARPRARWKGLESEWLKDDVKSFGGSQRGELQGETETLLLTAVTERWINKNQQT